MIFSDDAVTWVRWRLFEDRPRAVPPVNDSRDAWPVGDHMDAWGELVECAGPTMVPSPSASRRREMARGTVTAESRTGACPSDGGRP